MRSHSRRPRDAVEGFARPEPGVKHPRCAKGANACPRDDVGGVWGYAEFVKIMANPRNKQYRELTNWLGG